jgi:dihydroorotate dehydrogenase electron transfer subunit
MKYLEELILLKNDPICPDHFRMRLRSEVICRAVRPGQFVHLRLSSSTDPLLRRAFSFSDVGENWLEIIYQVVGRGTELMSRMKPGERVNGLGPLGNGFFISSLPDHALFVAGGVGVASLLMLAREMVGNDVPTTFLLGARNAERLLCLDEIKSIGCDVLVATDDGSIGFKGYVPDLMREVIDKKGLDKVKTVIYACGPIPMLYGVARLRKGLPAQISFESTMGCGLGACLGCVVPVTTKKNYARVCTEGPVFNADRINWDKIGGDERHD